MTEGRYQEVLGSSVAEKLLNLRHVLQQVQDKHLRAQYGITLPQFMVLEGVMSDESVNLGTLADAVHTTRGNITGIVDRLENGGYLRRERDRKDRRVVKARLTDKGKTVGAAEAELRGYLTGFTASLSAEEMTTLEATLKRLQMVLTQKKVG